MHLQNQQTGNDCPSRGARTLERGRIEMKTPSGCFQVVLVILIMFGSQTVQAQPPQCDPSKVLTYESCAKCHASEVAVWKRTPHYQTFEELSRDPRAMEICQKMGLRSAKRSDVCINCHFTLKTKGDKLKPVSGISCESCHGAAEDWIAIHNDYGGNAATKESETAEHRDERLAVSTEYGMRNTRDLYLIASSCFHCHTVPNEQLVNVGGHKAGSDDFELVRWSQGRVRHNFLRSDGQVNAISPIERLRVMYVVGLIADLEFSTRATAAATEKSTYGLAVANRAARTAQKLLKLSQIIEIEELNTVLNIFAEADLRTNNEQQLLDIADRIRQSGQEFAVNADGSELQKIDPFLPSPSEYK